MLWAQIMWSEEYEEGKLDPIRWSYVAVNGSTALRTFVFLGTDTEREDNIWITCSFKTDGTLKSDLIRVRLLYSSGQKLWRH
jgi:hypothetical protein